MAESKNIVLDIKDLDVTFEVDGDIVKAVNDVDFRVYEGETVGLVGETGAGKTTTALAALHLVQCPPGVVRADKIEVCGADMLTATPQQLEKIRGKDISMIFQDPMTSLNPVYTVGDQIAESIMLHENLDKHKAFEKAGDMLELVGIPRARAVDYPHQFSGGMKQRVVIAIALACNPKVLIADEPTTALDVTIQAQVLELMKDLKKKFGTGTIMITHDLGIVAESCDRVAVMYAGKIIETGTLDEVFNHTKHPYTEGLFNSLPNINDQDSRLKPIPGLMPDPAHLPEGCAFAERCKYATDACKKAAPEVRAFSETHLVRCTAYDDPKFHIDRKEED